MNTTFKVLKENGYIIHNETRVACYYLSDEAVKIVGMFKKNSK